jgi:hypothetical protein
MSMVGLLCSDDGSNRMALYTLGCATRSIPDFVRMEHRTVLAVASGERAYKAMRPLASRNEDPTILPMTGEKNEQAWREHYKWAVLAWEKACLARRGLSG